MRRNYVLLILVVVLSCCVQGQSQQLSLIIPDSTVSPNDTISVPIRTKDFDEIVSMQFSLSWNSAILEYVSFEDGDIAGMAVGDFQASLGELRLSWFDVEGEGQTLPDGSAITYLKFVGKGAIGTSTPLTFTNTPLPIQIFRTGTVTGEFVELKLQPGNGVITIVEPSAISVKETVSPLTCSGENDGKISIEVTGVQNFVIKWTGPNFTSDQATISGLAPGEYKLEISSPGGSVLYESTNTLEPSEGITITNIAAEDAACTTGLGRATVVFSGGTPPYQYDVGHGPGTESN
ncbi:MAG: hypothetical protein KTR30_07180, partial [Saprospiraceae bacterium]|nr:hypothetical protein [Saprospiraceae bacterium]